MFCRANSVGKGKRAIKAITTDPFGSSWDQKLWGTR